MRGVFGVQNAALGLSTEARAIAAGVLDTTLLPAFTVGECLCILFNILSGLEGMQDMRDQLCSAVYEGLQKNGVMHGFRWNALAKLVGYVCATWAHVHCVCLFTWIPSTRDITLAKCLLIFHVPMLSCRSLLAFVAGVS